MSDEDGTLETLPNCIQAPGITVSLPNDPTVDQDIEAFKANDLHHINNMIKCLYAAWSGCNTISKAIRLSDQIMKAVIVRRRLMLLQDSYKETTTKGFDPYS